jgi:hypothetical protein
MEKTYHDSLTPKNKEQVELADIFRLYGDGYRRSHAVSYEQIKAMNHIEICRTAKLGGHVEQCNRCGFGTGSSPLLALYDRFGYLSQPESETFIQSVHKIEVKPTLGPCCPFLAPSSFVPFHLVPQFTGTLERDHPPCGKDHMAICSRIPPSALALIFILRKIVTVPYLSESKGK